MPPPSPLPPYVYKILPEAPPYPLPPALPLSTLDAKDGFIHLSTKEQVPATAGRFFADHSKLWLLRLPLTKLHEGKGELKWEESKNHGCFAHLYGADVGRESVDDVIELTQGKDGLGWEKTLEGLWDVVLK